METFLRFLTGAVMLAVVIDGTMMNVQEPSNVRHEFKNAWKAVQEFFLDTKKINFQTPNENLCKVAATQAARNACDMYNRITEIEGLTRDVLKKPSPVEYSGGHVVTFSRNCANVSKDEYAKNLWSAVEEYALLPDVSTQLEFGAYQFDHNEVALVFVVIAISSACTLQNKDKHKTVDLMSGNDLDKIMTSISNISLEHRHIYHEGLAYFRTNVENIDHTGIDGTVIIIWGDLKEDCINLDAVCKQPGFPKIFEDALAELNADVDALYGFAVGSCNFNTTKSKKKKTENKEVLVCFIQKLKRIPSKCQVQSKIEYTAESPVSQSSFKTVPDLAAGNSEVQPKSGTDSTALVEETLLDTNEPTLKDQQQPMKVTERDPFLEIYFRKRETGPEV